MKTHTKYALVALAALTIVSLIVCGGMAAPVGAVKPPTKTPVPSDTPVPSEILRIESGGTEDYTDTLGDVWTAGYGCTSSGNVERGSITIQNTNDPRLYQTEEWGITNCAFSVPDDTYIVKLHFAETWLDGIGDRVFDVDVEGQSLTNFDPLAEAGGKYVALIKEFSNVVVDDGSVDITFTAITEATMVNAIEIIPASMLPSPTPTVTPGGPTNTPLPTDTPLASPTPANWTLLWSDEFDGPDIDTTKWGYEIGYVRNNELQYYTDRPENSYIQDGMLVIEGREESYLGYDYTSASLHTKYKADFTYGRFEARLSLPMGQGLWPAFWLLGTGVDTIGWPKCGEFDVMEHINTETRAYGTVHWDDNGHTANSGNTTVADPVAFHVYRIDWNPVEIVWYVDGVPYHTVNIEDPTMSELHTAQYILLNLAIGGDWPGAPDGSATFPQQYVVDYVRVYSAGPVPPTLTPSPTPAPGGDNQLVNPGLESGSTGWSSVTGNWSIEEPGAENTHSGTWAFVADATTASYSGPYQDVSGVSPDTDYVAIFYLKGSGAVRMTIFDGAWNHLGGRMCTATSTWTQCNWSFNTGSNTSLVVQMQDHAAGTAYVDDLYLGPPASGPTPTPTPVPPTNTPGGPTDTPAPPTATPTPSSGPSMHVDDITMTSQKLGKNYQAIATVTIVDAVGAPVEGATVDVTFTGAGGTITRSDPTDANGQVMFWSNRASGGGTFNVCVDNVTKTGVTYDAAANVETCDSITAP